jgi:hypothetical protein
VAQAGGEGYTTEPDDGRNEQGRHDVAEAGLEGGARRLSLRPGVLTRSR